MRGAVISNFDTAGMNNQSYSWNSFLHLFYGSNQRDAVLSSLFIVLQNHYTCFRCPFHPSSGVHKTAVTTTGTSHVYQWHRSKVC